jgi:PAS domain S-box-containing protein
MKKQNSKSEESAILRQRAEEILQRKEKARFVSTPATEIDHLRLIHELQVNQCELEMQNEELVIAKEKAELAEVKYTELYDFATSGYLSLSKDGEILELNYATSKMLGKKRSKSINNRFGFFVSIQTRPVFNLFFDTVFTSKVKQTCEAIIATEGNLPIYVNIEGIVSENDEFCLLTLTDNTKRKLIELELQKAKERAEETEHKLHGLELQKAKEKTEESEEKFKVVVENGAALMTITDTQGIVVFASPQCEKVIGWPIADVIGLNTPDFIHPDDKEMIIAEREKATALKPIKDFEYRIFDKQKNIRWISHSAAFIKNGDDLYVLSTIMDITERKQAELELIIAKGKAEESDRLKSAFLANMSHEIRTPMNGILGFARLLKMPDLSGEDQQEYIQIIEKSGTRMLNIINDIMDISKIESGLMNINISESNINEQIEYIYTFFKPEVEAKGMKLSFRNTLQSNEAIIKTDREKVFAILTNLVKNSIKYSQKGFIEFGYNKKGNTLEFFVKDTGIGIPKDRQSAIFERFIQGDIEDKMARQGAGLGLAITKAYTEMLDGRIWVESEVDIGSTFYFTLPYNVEI